MKDELEFSRNALADDEFVVYEVLAWLGYALVAAAHELNGSRGSR